MTGRAGFSLVELLVGIVFLSLFGLAVQQFCRTMLIGVRVLEAASEAQEAARFGVQLIATDAREAGFSPTGPLHDGVRRAGHDVFALARDLDADGDVDDANERVSYQYVPDRRALLRGQGDAPPQPLLGDLDDDGLSFTYLAADGAPLPTAGGELDAAQRARIRRVAVRLRIAIPHPYGEPLRAEQTATATLRNVD
jgi:type II secretory pathway component PulJ